MQQVFSKWLWEITDAKATMEEIITKGFTIIWFQIVPDNMQNDFYLVVVAERDGTERDPVLLSEN